MMTWQCNGGRKSIISTSRCGSKRPHLAESNNSRSRTIHVYDELHLVGERELCRDVGVHAV